MGVHMGCTDCDVETNPKIKRKKIDWSKVSLQIAKPNPSAGTFLVEFLCVLGSVAEPEPGAQEPPYFAGAGAGTVIFVKKRLRLRTR